MNFDATFMDLPYAQARPLLGQFNSYARTQAMLWVMCRAPTPTEVIATFLEWGNMCDAPFANRSHIAAALRRARASIELADLLSEPARGFFDNLPDQVPVWRGCEAGRVRDLHWTTSPEVAGGFAHGKRCSNKQPTLARALIPKHHILAAFVCRDENEIIVDPRRLRRLSATPL